MIYDGDTEQTLVTRFFYGFASLCVSVSLW
jgi:hypothetical protein